MDKKHNWSDEDLPENCPPDKANVPNKEIFYRLGSNPPASKDFDSHRKLYPQRKFRTTECIARSLSILNTLQAAKSLMKLPTLKHKKLYSIELVLEEKDGVVLQTGKNPNHYSWWKTNSFLIESCKVDTE